MNILFTCAGRRTYLLKYFKEQLALNGGGLIIATDMQRSAPALSVADVIEIVPSVYDASYIPSIMEICKKHKVDLLISLNDLELPILSAQKLLFKSVGTTLLVSDECVIDTCFDKYKTAEFLFSIGLNTPKTFINIDEAIAAINCGELSFPIVLKPRWGSGSIGIEFVDDLEELKIVYSLLLKKIKKTILSEASISEEYILIQEKIIGQEHGVDVVNDLDGNFVAVSVKKKLAMRAGETDKAMTIKNDNISQIGEALGRNLKHIGNLDCDIFEKDGKYYVLELNPRFGGGFPFSYEAGFNAPLAIIEWFNGNTISFDIFKIQYDKIFAKCDYLTEVKK